VILGPASALLEQELAQEVRRQGIVVWLDRDCSFTDFVQRLTERHAAGDFEHPVVGFRGSFMELLFALEAHGSGYDRTPLLIHMPGFNEDSIRETPVLELYSAGTRFRKALDTLIRQAATGRVAPDQVDQFLADKPTLEQADAWLGQASSRSSMGLPALLEASGPMLVIEALCGADSTLARQVKTDAEIEALRDYLHTLTGMDAEWREFLPKNGKSDLDGVLTALGAWLLCVEYVHDLRREPHLPALRRLKGVAPTLVKMSCKLVSDLRDQHADAYERLATDVEGLIQGELEVMTAEDLGQIDTFCEEEERVLAGAVAALKAQDWQKAQSWCKAREGGRSPRLPRLARPSPSSHGLLPRSRPMKTRWHAMLRRRFGWTVRTAVSSRNVRGGWTTACRISGPCKRSWASCDSCTGIGQTSWPRTSRAFAGRAVFFPSQTCASATCTNRSSSP